MFEHKLCSIDD